MLHTCTVMEGVTMTLPESENVDHPRKLEEKAQNADSQHTIYLATNSAIKNNLTTPQYN